MIWQQPWAALGGFLLAVPIVIHLLGQGRSKRHHFPSLRFISNSRLLPARRTRIHDPLLLLLRLLILGLAIAALAQPWFTPEGRRSSSGEQLARVIIVDTSASVNGLASDTLLRRARRSQVDSLTRGVRSLVLLTTQPAAALPGAISWLETWAGLGEITVVSDFQTGSIDSLVLSQIPLEYGLSLIQVGPAALPPVRAVIGESSWLGGVRYDGAATLMRWDQEGETVAALPRIELAGHIPNQREILQAAATVGQPESPAQDLKIFITLADSLNPDQRHGEPGAISRETANMLVAIGSDPLLTDLEMPGLKLQSTGGWPILNGSDGRPWLTVRTDTTRGGRNIFLAVSPDASPAALASLAAVSRRHFSFATDPLERLPDGWNGAELDSWNRPASSRALKHRPIGDPLEGPSDSRWFWAVVLLLLMVEIPVRRLFRTREVVDGG